MCVDIIGAVDNLLERTSRLMGSKTQLGGELTTGKVERAHEVGNGESLRLGRRMGPMNHF